MRTDLSAIPKLHTMYEQLSVSAKARPDAAALVYYRAHFTFSDLLSMVDECAAGLLSLGVKPGDRVTVCMPNIPQTVAAVYAINRIGAVCNMLHPLSGRDEIRFGVEHVKSRVAFCFDVSEKAFDGLPVTLIVCKTAAYFESAPSGWLRGAGYRYKIRKKCGKAAVEHRLGWKPLLEAGRRMIAETGLPAPVGGGDDLAAIMYTGGTTGTPKGVMLSNDAVNALAFQMFPIAGFSDDADGMLGALPFFHGFGFAVCMHTAVCLGMRLALIPRFVPKDCCDMILREKISLIFSVPAFFERLLRSGLFEGKDLSHIRLIGSGGDIVTADLKARLDALLEAGGSDARLISGYGLTESVTACTMTRPEKEIIPGCIGFPCAGNEVKVVAPGTTEAVLDRDGEICVTGPTLMKGYWEDPAETEKALRLHPDGKRWLHTGDIGSLSSSDGQLYFKQRLKRVLKISGYLVYPSRIEDCLRAHPSVSDCCVVGFGEPGKTRVCAFIIPEKGCAEDAETLLPELRALALEHLNPWSAPTRIELTDRFPLTKIGKVDVRALEARLNEANPS